MTTKFIDKRKVISSDSASITTQEKLLTSIDQLSQVLDILGKLVHRIKLQVEAIPEPAETNDKKANSANDQIDNKKSTLLH